MKLKFKKGTKLYKEHQFSIDASPIYQDSGKVLEEDFECEMPEKDYDITFAGPREKAVTAETTVRYKDDLYLKVGDASNYKLQTAMNNQRIKYGVIIAIAIAIIGIIWYKRKHK